MAQSPRPAGMMRESEERDIDQGQAASLRLPGVSARGRPTEAEPGAGRLWPSRVRLISRSGGGAGAGFRGIVRAALRALVTARAGLVLAPAEIFPQLRLQPLLPP